MMLPRDLLSGRYTKPRLFLCEVDKERICPLETTNTKGTFKFNSYSELNFEVSRVYNDFISGETRVNPCYDRIEAIRLIELEGIGYFEIQGPELIGDGIEEFKNVTAYSLEYSLCQKYLDNFIINTGEIGSVEVTYAEDMYGDINKIQPVVLYDPTNPQLSLLHLALQPAYGWTVRHVDPQLQTLTRQFDIDRESVYDFLMNDVCEKFNCYIVFNTYNNEISVYAESTVAKFIGDGNNNKFVITPPFYEIGTVSIDGYKTTEWEYNRSSGVVTLVKAPESGAHIEVIEGSSEKWETDVFISFDNLSQEVKVNYDADSIKTKLVVSYGDGGDIREVNLGLPYLIDLSYYYTVDWMGQDLYDAYTAYMQKLNAWQSKYTENAEEVSKLNDEILYEENRLSLEYSLVQSVSDQTVGTYYVKKTNSAGKAYYKEVSLPTDWKSGTKYYSNLTTNVNEDKVGKLLSALKKYFNNVNTDSDDGDATSWKTDLNNLKSQFEFMGSKAITTLVSDLNKVSSDRTSNSTVKQTIKDFLFKIWAELGRTPLQKLYVEPFEAEKEVDIDSGWSNKKHEQYGSYYALILFINTLNAEIDTRSQTISSLEEQQESYLKSNLKISDILSMNNNFTDKQLFKLNAFMREDKLDIEDIVETSQDSLVDSLKVKQDAMESGRIELQKICQPQLQFSMSMANIFALPEFAPIIDQFQLGKMVKVALRPDYIKQSRLMQIDINFDDFSDFSCEFGELTNLRSQSDIHADLLKNAISAGKSVATSSGYWSKGSDVATAIDLKIQQGLLDATTKIKAIDGNQGVVIDQYGIWLKKIEADGSDSLYQTRIVNNMILMSDDGFETSRTALGEIEVDGQTYYGLIAEMVLSGVVESSQIIGGTIKIGLQEDGSYAFQVDKDGTVTMNVGNLNGYSKEIVSSTAPLNPTDGQFWLDISKTPYELKVYRYGSWMPFSQKDGQITYISKPESYEAGDVWIPNSDELSGMCYLVDESVKTILRNNTSGKYCTIDGREIVKIGVEETLSFKVESSENETHTNFTVYLQENHFNNGVILDPFFFSASAIFFTNGYNTYEDGSDKNSDGILKRGDSIKLVDSKSGESGEVIYEQSDVKYYGTDRIASFPSALSLESNQTEVYLIYSNGQLYFVDLDMPNMFFCDVKNMSFAEGTVLQAVESSETFNYDHWIDITPNNVKEQHGIFQNLTFDKETGLKIGQSDGQFYVNIDSQNMGFHGVEGTDDDAVDTEVVSIGIKSATIQNATFEGDEGATFNTNTTFNEQIDFFGFVWIKESNGSLSLNIPD